MDRIIKIFDTTLRDGEQCPGASMNAQEKLELAHQLARLKVDIIEAGFPISSPGDFASVRQIACEVRGPTIAALARTKPEDVDAAGQAIQGAEKRRIHTFVATSDIHLQHKLRRTREEVLEMAVAAVRRAKTYTDDVEFSRRGRLAFGPGVSLPGCRGDDRGRGNDDQYSGHRRLRRPGGVCEDFPPAPPARPQHRALRPQHPLPQ